MRPQGSHWPVLGLAGVLVLAALANVAVAGGLGPACKARWAGHGAAARYSPGAGCRVLVDGRWQQESVARHQLEYRALGLPPS